MQSELIKKLKECAEELLVTDNCHFEGMIIINVIGVLEEKQNNRVRDIETGILKDLEKYYDKKIKDKVNGSS